MIYVEFTCGACDATTRKETSAVPEHCPRCGARLDRRRIRRRDLRIPR